MRHPKPVQLDLFPQVPVPRPPRPSMDLAQWREANRLLLASLASAGRDDVERAGGSGLDGPGALFPPRAEGG